MAGDRDRTTFGGFSAGSSVLPKPIVAPVVPITPTPWNTPDINSAFAGGWAPTGSPYTDYLTLTGQYKLPGEWVTANYDNLKNLYTQYQKSNGDPTTWAGGTNDPNAPVEKGPFDSLYAALTNNDPAAIAALTPTNTSYTGLSPEVSALVTKAMGGMSGIPGQYSNLLSSMASPASYISAQMPVQKALNEGLIRDLANKGILSSTQAEQILTESANKVPYSYLQNLKDIAPLFGAGVNTFADLANAGRYSESKITDPMAPYRTLGDLLPK